MGAFSNSPVRRRENGAWHFDNNQFDDLQPMTLDFDCECHLLEFYIFTERSKSIEMLLDLFV